MRCVIPRIAIGLVLLSSTISPRATLGQETTPTPPSAVKQPVAVAKLIEIPNDPKTVDPATLVSPKLAAPVSVVFTGKSIRDIAIWIQEEQKLEVLLDQKALSDDVELATEQITEQLQNSPLYLLLERLRTLGLEWYMEEGNLHITTIKVASQKLSTAPYPVGDLFDAGFKPDALTNTILTTTEGPWTANNNSGAGIVLLGDVLFVRQTDRMHREVAGLLTALRKHARRTLTLDAPQNEILRQKLNANVSVNFRDVPLAAAMQTLAKQTQIDIRLDMNALKGLGIRDRAPVTLVLADQKLSTVFHAVLTDLNLTWILRDGVLWITSQNQAKDFMKTAVYNVADLCRDDNETAALKNAIEDQTQGPWRSFGKDGSGNGVGGSIHFARPAVMVVRQTERGLDEVLGLLENYRAALRVSKPRKPEGEDPKEVIVRYYRVSNPIAEELMMVLPQLVRPETWKSKDQPKGVGTISKLKSKPTFIDAYGMSANTPEESDLQHAMVVQNSVLIIHQMREVQTSIAELIYKIENGDDITNLQTGEGVGLGGGQQGGFGGGFFSLPERRNDAK